MQGVPQIALIFLFALLLRWCVTYHPYSGQGKPPMFGDYEAQRHWQEITLNLPIETWYTRTTDNDVLYWGLDYPPLTAYHSLLLGYIANGLNSSYVKLYESRGVSSDEHKYFMRLTVLFADALVYIPAMIYFILNERISKDSEKEDSNILGFRKRDIVLLTSLIYPGLILIDHGHFQYNCISLGLFIAATTAVLHNSFIVGSFLFVAALNYKQMELYHSMPFFFYILGTSIHINKKSWLPRLRMLLGVSFTVILTFFVMWLPFLRNFATFKSVITRLFPLTRGLYEDKVSNFWCTINIVFKLRPYFSQNQLIERSLLLTNLAIMPSNVNLCVHPKRERFLIALINSALSFFLFSFHVHEKSILLVAIPVLLYFHNDPFPCFWFLLISNFSMLPLFLKDDLYLAYVATFIFYFAFVTWAWPDILDIKKSSNVNESKQQRNRGVNQKKMRIKHNKNKSVVEKIERNLLNYSKINYLTTLLNCNRSFCTLVLFYSSLAGITILSTVSVFVKPPERYPDLFPVLISAYSCGHFMIFYLYFNYKQYCIPTSTINKSKTK